MITLPPRIAVLMPVYSPGAELVQTLNSLKAQTVPFKLFIVDDGSPQTPQYDKLLQGLDYDLTISPRNLGVNEARNPGLAKILAGNFQLIALLDCGDIAMPNRLERQAEYLQVHPQIDILGSAVELQTSTNGSGPPSRRTLIFPGDSQSARERLWSNMPVSHPAVMMRRKVMTVLGSYSKTYPAAEDYDMMWRAKRAGFQIANLPDVLLIKQETQSSVSIKRRRTQVLSRLRIQWANRDLASLACLKGLVKSLAIAASPQWLAKLAKFAVSNG
jgi:glycosyltransferase involved in cell wall biosynthesis